MKKDEILKLPIYINQKGEYLSKKDIVTNFPQNFGIKKSENFEYATTSGTTSDRMEIIREPNWWQGEYKRTYSNNKKLKAVFEKKLPKIIFTTAQCSNLICFVDKPSLEKRIIGNTLYVNNTFNPWTWTKSDIKAITEEINYFKPFYLDADPIYLAVYLYLKNKYNIKTKLHIPNIMTLSYEFVPENVRKFIKRHIDTEIFNLYGTTEFGYIFLENSNGKMELCKELADVKLLPIDEKNNLYSLIVNSYKNKYMPLLNYRVGDMVVATPEQVKNFDTKFVVEKMAGRERDFLENNISYSMIDEVISDNSSNILFYQLFMINEETVILKYITENNMEIVENEKNKIELKLKEMIKASNIKFNMVEEISPEMSGKFSVIKRSVC